MGTETVPSERLGKPLVRKMWAPQSADAYPTLTVKGGYAKHLVHVFRYLLEEWRLGRNLTLLEEFMIIAVEKTSESCYI